MIGVDLQRFSLEELIPAINVYGEFNASAVSYHLDFITPESAR